MQKAGIAWKKWVVVGSLVTTLAIQPLWAKKPLIEQEMGKKDTITMQTKAPSAPALRANHLKRVPFAELKKYFTIVLENHKNPAHRMAAAQLMEQTVNPNVEKRFFIEFFEPEWKDSINAYLSQSHDTLSAWLNKKLYKCSKIWDSSAKPQNHSYGKLLFSARKNNVELRGVYYSYSSYDLEHTIMRLDMEYANTLIEAIKDNNKINAGLFGGNHYNIKERMNRQLGKTVNALVWDKSSDAMSAAEPHADEFAEKYARNVERPLIGLDVPVGLYKIKPGCGYARGYGIDYILVVDGNESGQNEQMPPIRK